MELLLNRAFLKEVLDGKPEGEGLVLHCGALHLLLVRPRVDAELLHAFRQGVTSYTYWESSTPAPVPVWIFFFTPPLEACDVPFNPNLADGEEAARYLGSPNEECRALHVHLLEGWLPRESVQIRLAPQAVAGFKKTLTRYLREGHGLLGFRQAMETVRKFNVSALSRFGMSFRVPVQTERSDAG